MACESGLNGHLGGFQIADLADEHDVRVLTQERAEHLRERIADFMVDRHLHDSVHIVFDRLLGGEDLGVDVVDAAENGIERGRLPRAGGPRHYDDAVRFLDIHRDLLVHVFGEADVLEIERRRALVEDTHNHRLAVRRRQARHAKIDRASGHVDRDSSVLRNTALGDVETGHDLDARYDRGSHRNVRRLHRVQRSVHTVADLEILLERLDVDVGSAIHDTLIENQVHELDDGVVVRGAFKRGYVVGIALEGVVLIHAGAERLEHVRDGVRVVTIVLGDAPVHVGLPRHHEAHFLRQHERKLV